MYNKVNVKLLKLWHAQLSHPIIAAEKRYILIETDIGQDILATLEAPVDRMATPMHHQEMAAPNEYNPDVNTGMAAIEEENEEVDIDVMEDEEKVRK